MKDPPGPRPPTLESSCVIQSEPFSVLHHHVSSAEIWRLESNPFSCRFVSLRLRRQVAPCVVAMVTAASFKWTGKENMETAGGDGVMGGGGGGDE